MKIKSEDCILKCENSNVNFGRLDSHNKLFFLKLLFGQYNDAYYDQLQ